MKIIEKSKLLTLADLTGQVDFPVAESILSEMLMSDDFSHFVVQFDGVVESRLLA